jgi:SAM-dependent methyltransferase
MRLNEVVSFYSRFLGSTTWGRWVDNDGRLCKIIELFRREVSSFGIPGLEVGCGVGDITWKIAQKVQFYVATDLASYAGFSSLNSAHFVICDATHLPFREHAFNWAIFSEVLEHLDRHMQPSVFVELARVLKHGGILLVSTPNPDSLASVESKVLSTFGISTAGGQLVENWVTPNELDRLVSRAGFRIPYRCGTYYLPPRSFSRFPRFVHLSFASLLDRLLSHFLDDKGLYQYRVAIRL